MFAKRNAFRSKKAEVKEHKRRMLASGLSALLILLVGVLVWYGARRPEVTIRTIAVAGGTTVSHDAVRAKVESALAGTYVLLIPKRFSYLYPEQEVRAAVNEVPRAHNATVSRLSRTELAVTFDEYMPYALWCDTFSKDASVAASCLFVDANGYAYASAPPLVGETLVRFVVEGRTPETGAYVHEPAYMAELAQLAQALYENHAHRIGGITATKDGDLTLHLSGGVDLMMTKETDINDAFAIIESVLAAPEFEDMPLEDFDYIDLRFGNTVYVKERGVEVQSAKTATTSSSY